MKKIVLIVLAVLLSLTACTNRTPIWILPPGVLYPDKDPEPEPCLHSELEATDWFDDEHHYPSAGTCTVCGETVTRDAIGIADADDLIQLAADINAKEDIGSANVDILDDIDMSGKEWTPIIIGKENGSIKVLTIDGNNHTINGLKTTDSDDSITGVGFIGEIWNTGVTVVVQNLTISDAEFTDNTNSDTGYVGGFAGYVEGAPSISFINCHLKSSKITSGEFAGGIYAWGSANAEATINIEGCTVDNCNLSSDGSVGGIVGHASANSNVTLNISLSSVTNSEITCTELLRTNKAGNIIGTVNCAKTALTKVSYIGNTVKSSFMTVDRCVGRLEFADGGSLSIDGRNVTEAE